MSLSSVGGGGWRVEEDILFLYFGGRGRVIASCVCVCVCVALRTCPLVGTRVGAVSRVASLGTSKVLVLKQPKARR